MKANEFDKNFEDGVDVTGALDMSKAKRSLHGQKRVNVDFPLWMIESLDREAGRIGVTHQSIIKVWLAERLEERAAEIAAQSPDAVQTAKRLLNETGVVGNAEGLLLEENAQRPLLGSRNQLEAMAANMGKRAPKFVDPE